MSKCTLDVDVDIEIEKDGVSTAFFIGYIDDPQVVKKVSFKELIDKFVEGNSVFDFLAVGFEEDTLEIVKALRDAADYAEELVSLERAAK
jgi:hypothetical protein